MHDVPLNQAIGLMGLGATQSPQLLAVVSHGDVRHEQPLLWQLGNALTQLGYGVTVLDGTVAETADNPGLQQLLDFQFGHGIVESDAPEWNVLPAALGIQTLCALGTRPTHSLLRLAQAFQTNGVVVLYAGVDAVVRLLGNTELRPLLCVSGEKGSLMATYLALKRLLRNGRLEPTVLNMVPSEGGNDPGVAKALAECARNFLHHEVQPVRIDPAQKETRLDMDMRHLATRLLENALPLRSVSSGNTGFDSSDYRELGRSH